MAVEFLDYQVIEFEDQNEEITKGYCGADDFVQLIDINDFTKFQVKSNPSANYPNTLSQIADSGWSSIIGQATYGGGNDDLRFDEAVLEDRLYLLTFQVSGMVSGTRRPGNSSALYCLLARCDFDRV